MTTTRRLMTTLAAGTLAAALAASAHAGDGEWRRAYEAGVIGGGLAAGAAVGQAAVSGQGGYDGGAPTGYSGGPGPADRPCFVRRPVYDENGTMIGYRGTQLC